MIAEFLAARVRAGGHSVPEAVVRRRFKAGLGNLFTIYPPVLDSWQVFDNSALGLPRLIASRQGADAPTIIDAQTWSNLLALARS